MGVGGVAEVGERGTMCPRCKISLYDYTVEVRIDGDDDGRERRREGYRQAE